MATKLTINDFPVRGRAHLLSGPSSEHIAASPSNMQVLVDAHNSLVDAHKELAAAVISEFKKRPLPPPLTPAPPISDKEMLEWAATNLIRVNRSAGAGVAIEWKHPKDASFLMARTEGETLRECILNAMARYKG